MTVLARFGSCLLDLPVPFGGKGLSVAEDDLEDVPPVPEIDVTRPHPARMYDYWLGGKNHFAADRAVADQVLAAMPRGGPIARENRKFLGREVRYLAAEAGIRQFLDIGSGLPATGNVHEVAQAAAPDSRVVYVDNDRCKSGCTHGGESVRSLRGRWSTADETGPVGE
jgi:hypothetical protein